MIIFRKSTNTNAFGLRGFWAYDPTTFDVWSFASSDHDMALGDTLQGLERFELVHKEGTVLTAKRKDFLRRIK
jgi:hypothetical protein